MVRVRVSEGGAVEQEVWMDTVLVRLAGWFAGGGVKIDMRSKGKGACHCDCCQV